MQQFLEKQNQYQTRRIKMATTTYAEFKVTVLIPEKDHDASFNLYSEFELSVEEWMNDNLPPGWKVVVEAQGV